MLNILLGSIENLKNVYELSITLIHRGYEHLCANHLKEDTMSMIFCNNNIFTKNKWKYNLK